MIDEIAYRKYMNLLHKGESLKKMILALYPNTSYKQAFIHAGMDGILSKEDKDAITEFDNPWRQSICHVIQ